MMDTFGNDPNLCIQIIINLSQLRLGLFLVLSVKADPAIILRFAKRPPLCEGVCTLLEKGHPSLIALTVR